MSGPINAITPTGFAQPPAASFTATNTTIAKILIDAYPAAVATTTAPAYYGGCTAIDLIVVSSDTVAKNVILYVGYISTTQDPTATGAITITPSTLVRTAGSWVTDGFQIGDQVMLFAPISLAPNAAVDGIQGTVTSVSALTITVTGTPFGSLTLAAGTRVLRNMPRLIAPIAIGAGTNGTTASAALLGTSGDGSIIKTEIKLGPKNVLIVGMQSAVSALPAVVSIASTIALY